MPGLFDEDDPPQASEPAAAAASSDWRRGYSLEHLKSLAKPFQSDKPHVYGAFGLQKERDLAAALVEGTIYLDSREDPQIVAIAKRATSASRRSDFRGEPIPIMSGDTVVSAIGIDGKAQAGALRLMLEALWQPPSRALWVEIFEENTHAKELVRSMGLAWVCTRISAGSEIKGLYLKGVHDGDFRERARLLRLEPIDEVALACLQEGFLNDEEHEGILAELQRANWTQHYSSYNKGKSWTAFALRGYADDPSFIIKPSEMSQKWKSENAAMLDAAPRWTAAAGDFPKTLAAVHRLTFGLDQRLDRVRFMKLEATSGELTRHADITDREAGTAPGRVMRLHIPIRTRESCTVSCWGIRGQKHEAHFAERSLCYLDQRRPHAVRNPESIDRIHLVVDLHADESIRKLFERAHWARRDH